MKKFFTLIAALVFTVAAMAETINVDGHKSNVITDGTLYQYAFDTEVGSFYFCITGEAVLNQHYNLSQMESNYTFFESDDYYAFTSVDFVMTGEKMYSATVACEDGNTYNLTVAPLAPVTEPLDTVYIDINSKKHNRVGDYTATNAGAFQLMGQDAHDTYYFSFTCYASQITGTYVDSNVYVDYTTLYDLSGDTTQIEFRNLLPNAVVTGDANALTATVNYVGMDSVLYIINFYYAAPFAIDTIQFEAEDLYIYMNYWDLYWQYMGYGYFAAEASDADYIFYAEVYTENDWYQGVYTEADAEVSFYNNDEDMELAYEAYTADFSISKTAGELVLTGSVLCYGDTKFYLLISGDASAVETVEASDYVAYTEGRTIVLNGAEGENAAIYDMAGRLVSNTTVNSDNARFEVAAAGVYVVRVNGQNLRVVVK